MKGHKQDYFIIIFAVILLCITFSIVYLSLTQNPPQEKKIVPTPFPTNIQANSLPLLYDNAAEGRLAQKILTRPTLEPSDTQQKNTTLTTILHGFNSGVLYETANVRLEYVQSADIFLAEIKTANITIAKEEISTWLFKQGFTQTGICNLPVMFYLNPEVSQNLQGKNVIMSPLPNNC
ncbi:MAG TPA: hypothetical protein VNW29_05130 [Candidatus Sulfotelmatobacter sp.]|jgi:hypothetical protein|nr:hypothetical protein [Candidatus Sulfotelmatobacter sp.]